MAELHLQGFVYFSHTVKSQGDGSSCHSGDFSGPSMWDQHLKDFSPSSHSYRRMERGHTGDVGGQTAPFMAFLEKSAFWSNAHSLGHPLFMWVHIRAGLTEKALSLKSPTS